MAITFDPSADFDYLDNVEGLTLRVSGQADAAIARAIAAPVTVREVEASMGQVRQGDVTFSWKKSETAVRPPLGSRLVRSDGTEWTILTIQDRPVIQTWEASGRDLAVEAGLDTLCSIQQATYTRNANGEAIPTWTNIGPAVRAKIQPISQEAIRHDGAEWSREQFRCIFDSDVNLTIARGDFRIVGNDGIRYRVTAYQQPERIDTLPVALLERITEGAEYHSSSSSSGV